MRKFSSQSVSVRTRRVPVAVAIAPQLRSDTRSSKTEQLTDGDAVAAASAITAMVRDAGFITRIP